MQTANGIPKESLSSSNTAVKLLLPSYTAPFVAVFFQAGARTFTIMSGPEFRYETLWLFEKCFVRSAKACSLLGPVFTGVESSCLCRHLRKITDSRDAPANTAKETERQYL
jgi:hypothetical protein